LAGSNQDLKNWNLLQSGQAFSIVTVAGEHSKVDSLLPSNQNNFVEDQMHAVEKWAVSSTPKKISAKGSKDLDSTA